MGWHGRRRGEGRIEDPSWGVGGLVMGGCLGAVALPYSSFYSAGITTMERGERGFIVVQGLLLFERNSYRWDATYLSRPDSCIYILYIFPESSVIELNADASSGAIDLEPTIR